MEQINSKLLNWASILEDNTKAQAVLTSLMPFVAPHVALMPDAHLGRGSTVGSVIPTQRAIMPAAVGVDIGCGMIALRTQFTQADLVGLNYRALRESIEEAIPLSSGNYNTLEQQEVNPRTVERIGELATTKGFDSAEQISGSTWIRQLGSLGGGNHFIEISADEEGRVWLFLHSGSRGVGNKLANKHIKIARHLCEKWWIDLPHPDLAYLVQDTTEFWEYIRDLRWAQKFAYLNREEMLDRVIACFQEWAGVQIVAEYTINCHHNYTEQERHFGRDVWLSRKGAIDASRGKLGLIPGSMGAASYVVEGKGNPLSFNSSPHGAGRVFSRTQARKEFNYEDLAAQMEKQGIEWRPSEAFLDEHPGAYKDIDTVMNDADDLVGVRHELHQLVNVKGD